MPWNGAKCPHLRNLLRLFMRIRASASEQTVVLLYRVFQKKSSPLKLFGIASLRLSLF